MASRYRQLEIDDGLIARSHPVVAKALEGGKQLTRGELGTELERAGIHAQGERLGHIMHNLEMQALICSGPRRGKQFTYMLLDERAPNAKILPYDDALALLTQRYFQSHAPATAQDFAWWSGLTVGDARIGLEMLKPRFVPALIDGKTYWYNPSSAETRDPPLTVHLLPSYDEFANGYVDYSPVLSPSYAEQANVVGRAFYSVNGRFAGMWKRSFQKGTAVITRRPFQELSAAGCEASPLLPGVSGNSHAKAIR
jgi:hypothetical protein